jgi:uncharacterized membrane protein
MLPDPLHPAIVHLPIALAILIPGLALLGMILISKGFLPVRAWGFVVLLQVLLLGSGWLAVETGEDQEERIERIVAERHIEDHEEAAERFLFAAGLGLLALGTGLLPERAGTIGRVAGVLVTFAVFAAGLSVGHSGGDLVYKHGAASAYVDARGASAAHQSSRYEED